MSDETFLHAYFLNNSGKPIHKWLHYFDIYEKHFSRFRGRKPTILEIGVYKGGSLEMWRAYFGEGARIIGLDINPECKKHEGENIEVFIGSQDDPALLDAIVKKYGQIDIVIDDGSHISSHMIATFSHLYDRISPTGVYFVEDTHACYWPKWGGGLKAPGSFMEFVKDRVDELHDFYIDRTRPRSRFASTTAGICVYDSIVAFERRPQGKRQDVVTAGEDQTLAPTMMQLRG